MIIGNIMLVLINLPLAVPLVQLLKIPQRIMLPLILGMAFMGTYFLNYSSFDFILVSVFALAGYLFWKLEIPIPPLVLALILGGTTEQSFRNAMTISGNDVMFFLEKPISLTLLLLAALSVAFSLYKQKRAAAKS